MARDSKVVIQINAQGGDAVAEFRKVGAGARAMANDVQKSAAGIRSHLDNISKGVMDAGRQMMSVGARMTAGITLPIVGFGIAAVRAFGEAQASSKQLEDALNRFPTSAGTTAKAIDTIAQAQMNRSRFDDDSVKSGAAVLAQFKATGKQIETLLPLVVDYAAKTGRDVPAAAEIVGKALQGKGRALMDVGIKYKDAKTEAGNYDQVVKGLGASVKGYAETDSKTLEGRIEAQKVKFGELKEMIGGALMPIMNQIGDVVARVSDAFANLSPHAQRIIVIGAGIAAAIGPVVGILGAVVTAIGFLISPIGLVIAAFAALAAGIVYAYQHFEGFRETVDKVMAWIKGAIPVALQTVKQAIQTFIDTVKAAWEKWGDDIQQAAAQAWAYVQREVLPALQAIQGYIRSFINAVIGWWQQHHDEILAIVNRVWNAIKPIVQAALNAINGVITTVLRVIRGDWDGAWEALKRTASSVWNGITAAIRAAATLVQAAAKFVWDKIKTAAEESTEGLITFVSSLPGKIVKGFGTANTMLLQVGKDIVQGLINGLDSLKDAAIKKAKSIATGIKDAVTGFFGINSPSRVFHDIGLGLNEGMINGIAAGQSGSAQAATSMAAATENAFKAYLQIASPSKKFVAHGENIASSTAKGIKNKEAEAVQAAKDMAEKAAQAAETAINNVTSAVSAGKSYAAAQAAVEEAQAALNEVQARSVSILGDIEAAENRLAKAKAEAAKITAEEQVTIERATKALKEAEKAFADGEISAAELEVAQHNLTKAMDDAVGSNSDVQKAESDLAELRAEQAGLAGKLKDAQDRLRSSGDSLTDSLIRAYQTGQTFNSGGQAMWTMFMQLAQAMGMSQAQIDALRASIDALPTNKVINIHTNYTSSGNGPNYGGGGDNGDGSGGTGTNPGSGGAYAKGGWFPSRPGGYAATIAEGGYPEVVAPEPMLRRIVSEEGGGGGGLVVNVVVNGSVISEGDLVTKIATALPAELARQGKANRRTGTLVFG